MPTNENKPRCPFCQAEFTGSHSCQASPKDDFFRGQAQDRNMTSAEIRNEREYYDRMDRQDAEMTGMPGIPSMVHIRKPWEMDKEEKEKEFLT